MLSIDQEYANAVASGDTQYASYLRKIMGGLANDPVAAASVGMSGKPVQSNGVPQSGAPASSDNSSILGHTLSSLYSVFTNPLGNLSATASALGGNFAPGLELNQQTEQRASDIDKGISSVSSGFDFITDIPRVATTLIGGLMIAAGLFALAGGSHSQIIQLITPSKSKSNDKPNVAGASGSEVHHG